MSIPVEIERLRAEGERYGPSPYLLTTGDDGRPHSVSVSATPGVLHRPAAPGVEIPEGCSADCRPLLR